MDATTTPTVHVVKARFNGDMDRQEKVIRGELREYNASLTGWAAKEFDGRTLVMEVRRKVEKRSDKSMNYAVVEGEFAGEKGPNMLATRILVHEEEKVSESIIKALPGIDGVYFKRE
jgi:hypothetical protein